MTLPDPLFPLGRALVTPGALEQLTTSDISKALTRHASGDWGDLDAEDKQANNDGLPEGEQLLSAYHSETGVKFWVITSEDRTDTTVFLPHEC